MRRSPKVGLLCVLGLAFQISSFAQSDSGPGFDPTPVDIPAAVKTPPRPITSMDLLTLRDLHGMQISPDGKYVAFVLGQAVYETNSYRSGLFVASTEKNGKLVGLGTAGPPHWDEINQWWPENPQWSADSKFIYYPMKANGTWQVWKWKREGGKPVQVTHLERNVQSFQVSPEGTKLLMTVEKPATDRKQLAEHGILYDGSIQEGSGKPILDEVIEARGVETETWVHDLRDKHERKATEQESDAYSDWKFVPSTRIFPQKEIEEQHILGAKASPDGNNVVYQRGLTDPSESAWYTYPLFLKPTAGDGPIALTPGLYYTAQYWWSPDSKEIYYTLDVPEDPNDTRPSKVMAVAATGGKPRPVVEFAGSVSDYSIDRSGRFLACTRNNATTPSEVALADLSTGEIRGLVDVNPEFKSLLLSPGQRIDVTIPSGEHFWAHLVLPLNHESGKRYPLIITTYRDGDAFLRGGIGDEYPIQVFAANGFAVLNFDAGKTPTYKPGDFETAIRWLSSPEEGMEAAIKKLEDMGLVDSSKVGLTGLSHGGEMVEYAIGHTNLFRAAIESSAGGRDPFFFYLGGKSWHKLFADMGLGGWPEGKSAGNWRKLSPALNVDRISTPLLFNAPDSEYLPGMQLFTSLEQLGKPEEMFVYPNEQHIKNQPKHRYEIYERNVDWFNFWLKDKEDPDPGKAEQYKRWHELRKLQAQDQSGVTSR
jgi:dipeptidyl aminopeptidase/acylaminoacyl peptidase